MYTIPGTPLLYNGQEAGLNKRLLFFEKDPIDWLESDLRIFYTVLNSLKENNPALHNGRYGGTFNTITVTGSDDVYAFTRAKDDNEVISVINFSDEAVSFSIDVSGEFKDVFTGEDVSLDSEVGFKLDAWGYVVLVNGEPRTPKGGRARRRQ
jgi:glycosidase